MDYQLMHKEIPVVDFALDDATAAIVRIGALHRPEHAPVGIPVRKDAMDRAALNAWWQGRAIPASRQGIRQALELLNIPASQRLLEKCLGLSLSDQYWIRPVGSGIAWSQVNFFQHPFSDDVGNVLFGRGTGDKPIDLMSPDNTSDGWLKKKWSVIDGKRCLIKGGSGATQQEPYNEVFASILMERLGVPHVSYTLTTQDGYPYSVCQDFVTPQTELVSAWSIMQTRRKENHVSVYQHYLDCCEVLGIAGVREALDRMLVVDYLLVNEDRHQNNFGAIRNADTLQWIGAAPIYDSGTALWFDTPTTMINGAAARIASKPFKTSHEEQIKLVTSFDWLDFDALTGIEDQFRILTQGSSFIDHARAAAICQALKRRVQMLKAHAQAGHSQATGTRHDVSRDTAYAGTSDK